MNKNLFLFQVVLILLLTAGKTFAEKKEGTLAPAHSGEHKTFIENKGQMTDMDNNPVPYVLFKKEAPGINIFITTQGLTYVFIKREEEEKDNKHGKIAGDAKENKEEELIQWERVDMDLKNASIKKENIISTGKSEDFSQYFTGRHPEGIKDVHGFEKIVIKDVYPGIDWVLYSGWGREGLKYDFIVHAGANAAAIKLLYRSRKDINLDRKGNLSFRTSYGRLQENAPVSYVEETKENISSAFIKKRAVAEHSYGGFETEITFAISSYNANISTLVIDPQLFWGTFFGGTDKDGPLCVTTDKNGNVYVTGYTVSTNFPTQSGGGYYQGTAGGGPETCFIQKFSNSGVRLWATYYGGNGADRAWATATDNAGNLFVTGTTESTNFPLQNAGTFFQGTYGGQGDAFFLKFDGAGNRLWATYYGGISMEEGFSITTDPSGNVFATGETRSVSTFPMQNAGGGTFFQGTFGAGTSDAYILKFDNAGNRLWATYAGGYDTDMGQSIATDANGNVFVTGYTWGGGFPVKNAGTFYQATLKGAGDIFIMKFDNIGTLLWSTYYGGGADEETSSIAADAGGNIFIVATTASSNLPTQNSPGTYFQSTKKGTWDAFILKFDNLGNRLWATYYGGTDNEAYFLCTTDNVAIDGCGNVYVSFETSSTDIPLKPPCDGGYYDDTLGGGYDVFLARFSNSGALQWATYFGGSGDDYRSPLAVDNAGALFLSGEWTDNNGPMVASTYPLKDPGAGAYFNTFNGFHDGCMAKFLFTPPTVATVVVNTACGCTGSATATITGGCAPFSYLWSNGQTTQTASGLCAGSFTVTVTDASCGNSSSTATIGSSGLGLTTSSTAASCTANNGTASVSASGGTSPYTYLWSPAGGTNSSATGLSQGTYTVTVTDFRGCTSTTTATVSKTVLVLNVPPDYYICEIGSVTLTASGGTSYSWSPGATLSDSTIANPVANPSNTTTYTVTVSNGSCSDTAHVTVHVVSSPLPPSVNQIADSLFVPQIYSSYQWYFNGVPIGGATNSYYKPTQAGTYSVRVTDGFGCSVLSNGLYWTPVAVVDFSNDTRVTIYPNPSSSNLMIEYDARKPGLVKLEIVNVIGEKVYEIERKCQTGNNTYFLNDLNLAAGFYFLQMDSDGSKVNQKFVIQK